MNPWLPVLSLASVALLLTGCGERKAAPSAPAATGDPMASVPWNKVSYNQGRTLGKNMADVGFMPDVDAYMEGIRSVIAGEKSKYTEAELEDAVKKFKAAVPSDDKVKRRKAIKESKAYLDKNRQRKEVTETPSGLQYEVLKAGDGPKPKETDVVKVHYHGTLVDGTVFDSSVERKAPIEFRLDGIIPGWKEGVLLMPKGSKYKFAIPDKLAYGEQGQGTVGPNQLLIFEVELLDINPPETPPPAPAK